MIFRDVDQDKFSAFQPDDDEGVNNEQVHGGDVRRVVVQKGQPPVYTENQRRWSLGLERDRDHPGPKTLVRWHRAGFRRYWRWEIPIPGRPASSRRRPARADPADERGQPTVGARRIRGELLKLGIEVPQPASPST